jgi:hypothetical protein
MTKMMFNMFLFHTFFFKKRDHISRGGKDRVLSPRQSKRKSFIRKVVGERRMW